MDTPYVLVLTTIPKEEADQLAQSIVAARVGACVQLQEIRSVYRWKGELCNDSEVLLMIKTARSKYEALEMHIKARHPYATPEIVQIPITNGSREYLAWIDENVKSDPEPPDA